MYRISKTIELDAGHRVPFHASKCHHLHGHRYKVQATVRAPQTMSGEGSQAGMVIDFGHLKQAMMESIHDRFDHRFMFWVDDPVGLDVGEALTGTETTAADFGIVDVPCIPTAEELSAWWFGLLEEKLVQVELEHGAAEHMQLESLTVYETPTSVATFTPS